MQPESRIRPRILTFNHHESFLSTLSGIDATFDVVTRYKNLDLGWNQSSRPVPPNFRLVDFDDHIIRSLSGGSYDVVICHTLKNLVWLWPWRRQRFVFVAHIPLFRYRLGLRLKSWVKSLIYRFFARSHQVSFVAVSEFKRASWRQSGAVTVLAPQKIGELVPKKGYDTVTVVCNQLLARRDELGAADLLLMAQQIPLRVIGRNPGVPFAIQPSDYGAFQQLFREGRIYLYTIRQPFGDGYNTAMLEAMQMGMAIVTVDNPSSPIIHGVNGLVGKNRDELIAHCRFLLANPAEVDRLGRAAAATVDQDFSQARFLDVWKQVLGMA
jgi:hypothetical protein